MRIGRHDEVEADAQQIDRVKAELTRAGTPTNPLDLDKETERLADTMLDMGERLTDADPAILREALRQFVSRIDCRWTQEPSKTGKQLRCKFAEGTVRLRPKTPFSDCGAVGHASKHRPSPWGLACRRINASNKSVINDEILEFRANLLPSADVYTVRHHLTFASDDVKLDVGLVPRTLLSQVLR